MSRRIHDKELLGESLPIRVVYRRSARARRFILRVQGEGVAQVTIPRFGSLVEARKFVQRHRLWLREELGRQRERERRLNDWVPGGWVMLHGRRLPIHAKAGSARILLGSHEIPWPEPAFQALAATIQQYLIGLARRELPVRTAELAEEHGVKYRRVTVRRQRTRWGSCSAERTISLNWRLVQCPQSIRDYVILHELMHLREHNHSPSFWRHVAKAFPDFKKAERWLRENSALLVS